MTRVITGTFADGFHVREIVALPSEELGRRLGLSDATPEEVSFLLSEEDFFEAWLAALCEEVKGRQAMAKAEEQLL